MGLTEAGKGVALNGTVDEIERLYRVVKRSRPDCITADRKITPALFKDNNGVSVDRDGGRNEDEIISFITNVTFRKRTKAVAMIKAENCFEIGVSVDPAPSEINPYHANIMLDKDERRGNLQALQLADFCRLAFFDDSVEWI